LLVQRSHQETPQKKMAYGGFARSSIPLRNTPIQKTTRLTTLRGATRLLKAKTKQTKRPGTQSANPMVEKEELLDINAFFIPRSISPAASQSFRQSKQLLRRPFSLKVFLGYFFAPAKK
jgi:hypothetical protein